MGRSIGGRKVEPLETPTLITVSSCESLRRCRRWSARGLWAAQLTRRLAGRGWIMWPPPCCTRCSGALCMRAGGYNAPDSGNAELIALGATPEQRERWLEPIPAGTMPSAFSVTEPGVAGSDPTLLETRAVLDGDEWFIRRSQVVCLERLDRRHPYCYGGDRHGRRAASARVDVRCTADHAGRRNLARRVDDGSSERSIWPIRQSHRDRLLRRLGTRRPPHRQSR